MAPRGYDSFLFQTTPVFNKEMGRRLMIARCKMKLKQDELAKLLGVNQSEVSRIELNRIEVGNFTTGKLKEALGRHFDYVFHGTRRSEYEPNWAQKRDQFGNFYMAKEETSKEE